MLNNSQLISAVKRWAKAYRPSLASELSPLAWSRWANEKAKAIREDYESQRDNLVGKGLSAQQVNMRLRLLWEETMANHLPPAMSEDQNQPLPKMVEKAVEAEHRRLATKWEQSGLSKEEQAEVWDLVKGNVVREQLEAVDASRMGP